MLHRDFLPVYYVSRNQFSLAGKFRATAGRKPGLSQTLEIPPAWIGAVQLFSAFEYWKQTALLFWTLELEFESYPQVLEHLRNSIELETIQAAWARRTELS